MPRLVAAFIACTALLIAPAAQARPVDVPTRLSAAIPKAAASGLPVLLPATMSLDYRATGPLFPFGQGSRAEKQYSLSLAAAKRCGANACFLAEFVGERGKPLGYKTTNVALARGLRGYYLPLTCGGSCSPPSIQWIQGGVRYEFQAKVLGGRKAFVTMANSAIRAGDRG